MDKTSKHAFHFDILPKSVQVNVHAKRDYAFEYGVILTLRATTVGGAPIPASDLSWPYSRVVGANYLYMPDLSLAGATVLKAISSTRDIESITIEAKPWKDKSLTVADVIASMSAQSSFRTAPTGAVASANPVINVLTLESAL
ncbi:hypothetical protein [Haematomicrobium sanguinis]|uniref:hypothetical protein n=1 Tax=Haematomicrobium sanguinis TaxID=479106 RepID=UPI00047B312F|nr:hypothetical protein [Haematomicrobium sanguinis]